MLIVTAKEEEKQKLMKWSSELKLEREQLEQRVKQLSNSITVRIKVKLLNNTFVLSSYFLKRGQFYIAKINQLLLPSLAVITLNIIYISLYHEARIISTCFIRMKYSIFFLI